MQFSDHIKKYKPQHFEYSIKKSETILTYFDDVDKWVRNIPIKDNVMWIKIMSNIKKNDEGFFEESIILTTIIISLFMRELEIPTKDIKLSNTQINKLLSRFDKIIRLEYAYKKGVIKRKNNIHTLLIDAKN